MKIILRTFTCIFQQISVGISKNSSMNQSTSMDMLNSTIDIIVDVRGIKLKFGVDKVLNHVCNKTGLKNSNKRNVAIKQIRYDYITVQTTYWFKVVTSLKQKKSINPTRPLAWSRPMCRVPYILSISFLLSCTIINYVEVS